MVVCTDCGCDNDSDDSDDEMQEECVTCGVSLYEKVEALAKIVGNRPDSELREVLLGAGGDLNRATNHFLDNSLMEDVSSNQPKRKRDDPVSAESKRSRFEEHLSNPIFPSASSSLNSSTNPSLILDDSDSSDYNSEDYDMVNLMLPNLFYFQQMGMMARIDSSDDSDSDDDLEPELNASAIERDAGKVDVKVDEDFVDAYEGLANKTFNAIWENCDPSNEVWNSMTNGLKTEEIFFTLFRMLKKKRITVTVSMKCDPKNEAVLTLQVTLLPKFFSPTRGTSLTGQVANLLAHPRTKTPKPPCAISKQKGEDSLDYHEWYSPKSTHITSSLYKYMQSDGYPITVPPAAYQALEVELREYQQQVVSWMVDRENSDSSLCDAFWERRELPNGAMYYYSPTSHIASLEAPPKIKGGILAEEMGLGKTVEIIALILANPPKPQDFINNVDTTTTTTTTTTATSNTTSNTTTSTSNENSNSVDEQEEEAEEAAATTTTSKSKKKGKAPAKPRGKAAAKGKAAKTEKAQKTEKTEDSTSELPKSKAGAKATGKAKSAALKKKGEDAEAKLSHELPPTSSTLSKPKAKQRRVAQPVDAGALIASGATLIVCPVSLLQQWKLELENKIKSNKIKILVYHGAKRPKDAKVIAGYDVVLTSYSILTHDRSVQRTADEKPGPLETIRWYRIVLDESHYVKNRDTLTSKLCKNLQCSRRWAVTGTPIQQAAMDLSGLIEFLDLKPFAARKDFEKLAIGRSMQKLLRLTVMRHTKNQQVDGKPIISLPPKTEKVVLIEPTEKEARLYKYLYSICRAKFVQLQNQGALARNYANVMSTMVLPLRQMCDHSSLVQKARFEDDTRGLAKKEREAATVAMFTADVDLKPALINLRKGKREDLHEIFKKYGHPECPICLEVADLPTTTPCLHLFCGGCARELCHQAEGQKSQCPLCRKNFKESELFDVFKEELEDELEHIVDEQGNRVLNIDPEIEALYDDLRSSTSSKVQRLIEELKEIRKNDPSAKSVVFTQWTPLFKMLENELKREDIPFCKLTGTMTMAQKGKNLAMFQSEPNRTVFLLSLRSGAVGLTLTSANHLFLLDPCMNKGTELQAVNRVHRIGQTRETTIHRMIYKNTIEEKILEKNSMNKAEEVSVARVTNATNEKASIQDIISLFDK